MHNKTCSVQLLRNFDGTWKLVIDPVDVWIKKNNEQVQWDAEGCDVTATMKGSNPFNSNGYTSPKGTKDGKTGSPWDKTQAAYAYTLTITPNPAAALGTNGNLAVITVDPQIIVDDNGPPAGGTMPVKPHKPKGSKKAAQKKAAKKKVAKKQGGRKPPRSRAKRGAARGRKKK